MKTAFHLIATSALLGCVSGEGFDDPELDPQTADDASALPSSVAPGTHAEPEPRSSLNYPVVSCPNARLIGVLDPGQEDCSLAGTLPGGWNAIRMFDTGSPDIQSLGVPAPGALGRYCMYEPEAPSVSQQDYIDLFDQMHASGMISLNSVAPDCLGQGTQGTDLYDTVVREGLQEAFGLNVDRVDGIDLGSTVGFRANVDLGVIDSTSGSAAAGHVTPINEHGLQIAAIIEDLACPSHDPSCIDNLNHFIALPRTAWDTPPNWIEGGHQGTQGDLAMAVYAAVRDWNERLGGPGGSERLVLNLSLGWERGLGEPIDPSRGPMRSLQSALEYASCSGALVFVAAGNNPSPGCEDETETAGPTEPAAFENIPAPDSATCTSLGFTPGGSLGRPVFGGAAYRPLVYAVGGVDEHDQPLINARTGGQPRLVALGSNGVGGVSPNLHAALTGTSVSAAVASGAAALIWSYRPELRPSEVAELLYDTGYATGDAADFGGGVPNAVRRVSVCAALASACAGKPSYSCPQLTCTASAPATDGNLGTFFFEVDTVYADVVAAETLESFDQSSDLGTPATCGISSWDSLLDPQPETPICSHCSIDVPKGGSSGDDQLTMDVDPLYKGDISSATLVSYDASRAATTYVLDSSTITALNRSTTDLVSVTLDVPDTISAVLEFEVDKGGRTTTQSNPITVRSE
ncbi:Subtilase family protein [Enhygromyxa salina]|uniref:Subtilase family protein n=1 Tax=Enhygromyxa salina TaxID=215803 RepID=A0A2S9XIY7_9BACT|nr:S8/S53 family peptidase [Enhygromyxa salina]PRP92838.1 Subtilase family protein [Enhygromyxa salina]